VITADEAAELSAIPTGLSLKVGATYIGYDGWIVGPMFTDVENGIVLFIGNNIDPDSGRCAGQMAYYHNGVSVIGHCDSTLREELAEA
jgi:hypothetical protein